MDKENNNEANAPQPYTGPLLFINKTSVTLARDPGETFTIFSHVSKTHRKWLKEEKLKNLHASSGKAVVQRAILPVKQQTQVVGSSRQVPLVSYRPARAPTHPNQWRGDMRTSYASGFDRAGGNSGPSTISYLPSGDYLQPVYPFEAGQEKYDQEREAPSKAWNKRFRASNRPPLAPFKGNSDPFSAAALPLAARDHEIIRQAQQFFVFVAWPDKRSAVWRAPISDSSSSRIRLRQTVNDEAEIHAILAAGYAVHAEGSKHESGKSLTQGLFHKTKAVALLRDRLVKHGFSQSVTTLIRLLISLDFHASDNEAALVHLRGLWALAGTTPGILVDAQELLRVSDAWISISLLKKPEISPTRYDPGGRWLQPFDHTLRALERENGIPSVKEVEEGSRSISAFDGKTWMLLTSAQEIVNTKNIMDKIEDPDQLHEVIQWMNKRSSAVTGFCTTGYVDNIGAPGSPKPNGAKDVNKTLAAAACLCGIMFMNFKFQDMPTNYNFSRTCQQIEQVLRIISARLEHKGQKDQDSDYLWLLFLTTMGTDIFSARGDIPYSPWLAPEFHRVSERLRLTGGQAAMIETLRRYPYYAEMGIFLPELCSQMAPSAHIISWSRWRDILNHA